ncbi:MAG TPA: hypothetical protein VED87_12345 [Methylocystis sp.]|nr:hypothetical protein [Methylocystis sp.]
MELEQFYVYQILSPLTPDKITIIEQHIDDNAATYGQNVTRSWHGGEEEHFLRIFVEPAIIEIVFLGERVELYGAAPTWARLLFTAQRKEELRARIEEVLVGAGFVTLESLEAQRQPKRKLFARARERNGSP